MLPTNRCNEILRLIPRRTLTMLFREPIGIRKVFGRARVASLRVDARLDGVSGALMSVLALSEA